MYSDGSWVWQEVQTASNGDNTDVWLTTLIQTLQLVTGESPFYSNRGIPAIQSVVQQVFPDFYVNQIQQQFSPYFASLIISKLPSATPTYQINIITKQGAQINGTYSKQTGALLDGSFILNKSLLV